MKQTRIILVGFALLLAHITACSWSKGSSKEERANLAQMGCRTYAERYGFHVTDKALCDKYYLSEAEAGDRLQMLLLKSNAKSYCELYREFADSVDLEEWVLADAAFRMSRLATNDEVLRRIRIERALSFGERVARQIRSRQYADTNCPEELRHKTFVFERNPRITVTEAAHAFNHYEEVRKALYDRRLGEHALPKYPSLHLLTLDELSQAKTDNERQYQAELKALKKP